MFHGPMELGNRGLFHLYLNIPGRKKKPTRQQNLHISHSEYFVRIPVQSAYQQDLFVQNAWIFPKYGFVQIVTVFVQLEQSGL